MRTKVPEYLKGFEKLPNLPKIDCGGLWNVWIEKLPSDFTLEGVVMIFWPVIHFLAFSVTGSDYFSARWHFSHPAPSTALRFPLSFWKSSTVISLPWWPRLGHIGHIQPIWSQYLRFYTILHSAVEKANYGRLCCMWEMFQNNPGDDFFDFDLHSLLLGSLPNITKNILKISFLYLTQYHSQSKSKSYDT